MYTMFRAFALLLLASASYGATLQPASITAKTIVFTDKGSTTGCGLDLFFEQVTADYKDVVNVSLNWVGGRAVISNYTYTQLVPGAAKFNLLPLKSAWFRIPGKEVPVPLGKETIENDVVYIPYESTAVLQLLPTLFSKGSLVQVGYTPLGEGSERIMYGSPQVSDQDSTQFNLCMKEYLQKKIQSLRATPK
ncbi:hypothetical protein JFK97_05945 [Chromobacterium phragmitis]|uniref:hypothetical protein n=1 Tax=Chromobacterium amazonense TaxID=1382803 RepID=UPI0021B7A23D|nr:hypothetical protein [Chromobacterium amazonense]MBM2883927.1 hypothetical protein [Chromobacterium amazonense]MDE1711844.1 hypothetical protein [Chromobacterium amazonense]